MPTNTFGGTPSDVIIRAYYPDHSYAGDVYYYSKLTSEIGEFSGTAQITIPHNSDIGANEYTKNSTTKTGYNWGFSEYSFDIIYRGETWLSGPCLTVDDKDVWKRGKTVAIDATLGIVDWPQWLLGGRVVMGTGGNRFAPTSDKADDVLKAVLRANLLAPASGGIEPSAYGIAGVDREDFGSITVAIAADTGSHADTATFRWDHGEPLWDAVLEFCRRYSLKLTYTWSGSTITLNTAALEGSDLTSSVVFDRERGNLVSMSRKIDRGKVSNANECRGVGRRTAQVKGYSFDTASIADFGVRESGEVHRSGNSTDVANGAAFMSEQFGGADVSYDMEIIEVDGIEYGVFTLSDKVTVYCSVRDTTVTDYITKGKLDHDAGKEVKTSFGFGRPADNANQSGSRSGGGGRGSRKGGGKPKNKDGESVVDPDEIYTWAEIITQSGGPLLADEYADTLCITGEDPTTLVARVLTRGTDPGVGQGTTEELLIEHLMSPQPGLLDPDNWFYIRGDDGGLYKVPIESTIESAPEVIGGCP